MPRERRTGGEEEPLTREVNEKKIKTLIDNAVFEAVIAEKAPPGWSEEKMMKLKASLRKQGKNEELAFPIAWSIYNKSQE